MARILVIGGTGLLGSTVVPWLRDRGHTVWSLGRSARANLQANVLDAVELQRAMRSTSPDVVVHMAGATNVDACERNPQTAFELNVRSVENCVQAMRAAAPPAHLVYISTDHIYNQPGRNTEEQVVIVNHYAASKYAGELAAQLAGATVLRTNFFGASHCQGRVSFSDWIVQSLRSHTAIDVFTDVEFSPLRMESVARFLSSVVSARPAGVFNLGAGTAMSKAAFASQLAQVLNLPQALLRPCTVAERQLAAPRPQHMASDSSRLENALGLAMPTLEVEIQALSKEYDHAL